MYHCSVTANTDRPGTVGAPLRFTTAELVLQQVATFYQRAHIPVVSECREFEMIVKLLDDNNKLRAINKNSRETLSKNWKKISVLQSTFQLWPLDAETESLINNSEDLAFLQSMKGSFDKVMAQKIGITNVMQQLSSMIEACMS